MKYSLLLLLTTCFLLTACSKDPDNESNTNDEHFSCDIDNNSFNATGSGVYALKDIDGPGTSRVYGTRDPGDTSEKLFSILIDDSSDLDIEYDLDQDNFVIYLNDGENQYASLPVVNGEGTIKVTKRSDSEIVGEFSCTMGNITGSGELINITNGTFDVRYQ